MILLRCQKRLAAALYTPSNLARAVVWLAYWLGVVLAPGAVAQGPLTNGICSTGVLGPGQQQQWTLNLDAGDTAVLRVSSETIFPRWTITGPDGVDRPEQGGEGVRDQEFFGSFQTGGVYTVTVSNPGPDGPGIYSICLGKGPGPYQTAPGDEGQLMTSGRLYAASLPVGDVDVWSFQAPAGSFYAVSAGSATNMIQLSVITAGGYSSNTGLSPVFTGGVGDGGLVTVLISSLGSGGSGAYTINHFVSSGPIETAGGDEGGKLINGRQTPGRLALGDIDVWDLDVTRGEKVFLRVAAEDINNTVINLFDVRGVILQQFFDQAFGTDIDHSLEIPETGRIRLTLQSVSDGMTGSYFISSFRTSAPVDSQAEGDGGELTHAVGRDGRLDLGDLDPYFVTLEAGERVTVRTVSDEVHPKVTVVSPGGIEIGTDGDGIGRSTVRTFRAPESGTYSVIIRSFHPAGRGTYTVRYTRLPPDLIVPAGLILPEGNELRAGISAQNPEQPDKPLAFALVSGPSGARLEPAGPTNAVVVWQSRETDGPGTAEFMVRVTDTADGEAYNRTNAFQVAIQEINQPPLFAPVPPREIAERSTLSLQPTVTDPDLPPNPVTFRLLEGPSGMEINPQTGALSWIPTEAQGPAIHPVLVVATDSNAAAVNSPALSATNRIEIRVTEVNSPPVFAPIADFSIPELEAFSVLIKATDEDLPANAFTYELMSGPAGLTLNARTGELRWTPEESQGPGVNSVIVRVTDGGTPVLAATNTFVITVQEVNSAPSFEAMPVQITRDETTFRIEVVAWDADVPAQALRYSLGTGAPVGVTIHPETGELTWSIGTRLEPETHTLRIQATDDGSPARSDELALVVRIEPPVLRLAPIADQVMDEEALFSLTIAVTNSPRAQPPYAFALEPNAPEGMQVTAATGALFWRPAENQGPSTNQVFITVTDRATPPNSSRQSIVLRVREVNQPPAIASIATQHTVTGGLLTVFLTATDPDVPANDLSYFLAPGTPDGITIHPKSGILTWLPQPGFEGTTNEITVGVSDHGLPALDANRTFRVIVAAALAPGLKLDSVEDDRVRLRLSGAIGQSYLIESSPDLRTWNPLTNFVNVGTEAVVEDQRSPTTTQRYYRAAAR